MSEEKKNEQETISAREKELDDFWDISALVPPKKEVISRVPASVEITEITAPVRGEEKREADLSAMRLSRVAPASPKQASERTESDSVITRYIPPHSPEQNRQQPLPDEEYAPQSGMLHRVRIYRWKTAYQYYEDFCRHAEAFHERRGAPCSPVAFFSYVPQYAQMNRAQLNWYFCWRDCARRGEILPADYSYILLYVFEIINLADKIDVHIGQKQLCALRAAFRGTYPRLGHLLNEWICDYSLIHRLPPPDSADLQEVADCTLKEFYVPDTDASLRYAHALMAFGSNYSYVKSKFAAGENRELYDRHMPGALQACIADSGEVGQRMAGAGLEETRLIRDAYVGALCSHRVKRRIEIDYCSFARSHELRILVTDIMKYTENKLRAYLGVKSRLGLYALPQAFRDCIDRYLQDALPGKSRAMRAEPRQEYEALYDVPKTAFSAAHAAEIEASSWTTTDRLISAFGEETIQEPISETITTATIPEPVSKPAVTEITATPMCATESDAGEYALLKEKLGDLAVFVNFALSGEAQKQIAFARERGEMIDSLADRINEIAADILGDILLEEAENGGYTVLEDYRAQWEEQNG